MDYQKLRDGTLRVEVLGTQGSTTKEGAWVINDQKRDPSTLAMIWPLLEEQICSTSKRGLTSRIRVSPAVAMHLVFERVLSEEHFANAIEAGDKAIFDGVTCKTQKGQTAIRLIVERSMLQKRGYDYEVMDFET